MERMTAEDRPVWWIFSNVATNYTTSQIIEHQRTASRVPAARGNGACRFNRCRGRDLDLAVYGRRGKTGRDSYESLVAQALYRAGV